MLYDIRILVILLEVFVKEITLDSSHYLFLFLFIILFFMKLNFFLFTFAYYVVVICL